MKREEINALSTQTHTQNMGQDNNSPTENNMTSGTFGQWIEKETKYMHFQHKYTSSI